jgi:hypothetical protein
MGANRAGANQLARKRRRLRGDMGRIKAAEAREAATTKKKKSGK